MTISKMGDDHQDAVLTVQTVDDNQAGAVRKMLEEVYPFYLNPSVRITDTAGDVGNFGKSYGLTGFSIDGMDHMSQNNMRTWKIHPLDQGTEVEDSPGGVSSQTQEMIADLESYSNIDLHNIPIGDQKLVTDPKDLKPGMVLVSPETKERMSRSTLGAVSDGPQINPDGTTYDLGKKLEVSGDVPHPNSEYQIMVKGDKRIITGNAIPETNTGQWPQDPNTEAAEIDPNPNGINEVPYTLVLPVNPDDSGGPYPVGTGAIGVLKDGSILYAGIDAQGNDAVAHENQDIYQGHPSPQHYHHHGVPYFMYEGQDKKGPSPILGYALDGYPIVAAFNEKGELYTSADLDQYHGKEVEVIDGQGNVSIQWAYCVTLDWPYTVGAYKGKPVQDTGGLNNR